MLGEAGEAGRNHVLESTRGSTCATHITKCRDCYGFKKQLFGLDTLGKDFLSTEVETEQVCATHLNASSLCFSAVCGLADSTILSLAQFLLLLVTLFCTDILSVIRLLRCAV